VLFAAAAQVSATETSVTTAKLPFIPLALKAERYDQLYQSHDYWPHHHHQTLETPAGGLLSMSANGGRSRRANRCLLSG